ncbi:helix-turn-helix transcriptional regulator [Cyanobacterium aponinum]|uniref:Helix-turn-helix domain-containing protein n=1 Tax=Cyanobacterium aponinum 0216 TaxID=2676140 RepID=A0A844GT09_9CHRO|nr:AraC family transcriptional regulator [Cyanobacterium aponinum]MTF38693.1 helix-turn-helix domain-containing protein [Cyanobacterium aponinum 0216]
MTIKFDNHELKKLSQQYTSTINPNLIKDKCDRTYLAPEWLGKGYKREIVLRNGISLIIHNYQLFENVIIDNRENIDETLEIAFKLSLPQYIPPNINVSVKDGFCYVIGKNNEGDIWQELANIPSKAVDIHLNESLVESLINDYDDSLPQSLKPFFLGNNNLPVSLPQIISPQMKMVISQIINCSFQGITKQIYLEAKTLELLALKIDSLRQIEQVKQIKIKLKKEDIEAIYHAEKIIVDNYNNPPSLIELSRQVGINTRKLKEGFRQIFHTTVFDYLYHYRMNLAQNLLKKQKNVGVVAQTIGYASATSFNAAFQKQFGVTPKLFQLAHR